MLPPEIDADWIDLDRSSVDSGEVATCFGRRDLGPGDPEPLMTFDHRLKGHDTPWRGGQRPGPQPRGIKPAPETAATITRRGIDLRAAAETYLNHRDVLGDVCEGWALSPEDRSESDRLFLDLHKASTASAERLALGLTSIPEPGDIFLGFRIRPRRPAQARLV